MPPARPALGFMGHVPLEALRGRNSRQSVFRDAPAPLRPKPRSPRSRGHGEKTSLRSPASWTFFGLLVGALELSGHQGAKHSSPSSLIVGNSRLISPKKSRNFSQDFLRDRRHNARPSSEGSHFLRRRLTSEEPWRASIASRTFLPDSRSRGGALPEPYRRAAGGRAKWSSLFRV